MASLMIGIMLLTALGASLGGTGIEALFFSRFGVDYLPYMYIGLGITSMLTSFLITAALGRLSKTVLYTSIPVLIAALLIGVRFALFSKLIWLYPALWLGKEVLNSLITLVIWGMAGLVCDTRQAKRLFPLFNASRILGQVIGGFATGALVGMIGTENLLFVWAGSMALTFLLIRALTADRVISSAPRANPRRKPPSVIEEMQRGFHYVRRSQLMTWISISTIFFSVLYFSIALPFSRAATEQYINEDSLASFLGLFNGLSTASAFLTSLFFANRLFARFGVMLCIFALPVIYFIGFGALTLAPLFAVIVAFRFAQMLWLSGIADPAWQTMLNVIPPDKRDQVRAFLSGIPEQAGTFIAGGILIIGEQTLLPQQLYIIGLIAAAACAYIIRQASRGYNQALLDALRAGRPTLFFSEEQPFGGFRQDAAAIQTALNGLRDPDPLVRRVSTEIVGNLALPEAAPNLINGISDVDPLVRIASLKALSTSKAGSALLDIAASLSDPEPDVRHEAISSLMVLSLTSPALTKFLTPLLDDDQAKVSTHAAASILRLDPTNEKAKFHLRHTAGFGDSEARFHAITALGEWGDVEAFEFLANELKERQLEIPIRCAILVSLKQIDPQAALSYLLDALSDSACREISARMLGQIDPPIFEPILERLRSEKFMDGALSALSYLPSPPSKPIIEFATMAVFRSSEYHALLCGVRSNSRDEAGALLAESLREKSDQFGIRALRAIGLLGDRDAMELAIDNLKTRDAGQRANLIEALDSMNPKWRDILNPLTKLWEDDASQVSTLDWQRLFADNDGWLRDCALFAAHRLGVKPMENISTLLLMERILFFKRVPLFANLPPVDLKQVASIAMEEIFNDGEEIAREGEMGDVMFIIVQGEVRVCSQRNGLEVELARRGVGDCVGEMSIISREPRMASLIAAGDVRTLCIDQKSFEGLLRERPDVSLAVIHELNIRLKEMSFRGNE